MTLIRKAFQPAFRRVMRGPFDLPYADGDGDPILALFANGEQGLYIRDPSSYFSDTSRTTSANVTDTVAGISDFSGQSNSFSQADVAKRAVRNALGIEFDGVDDEYSIPTAVLGSNGSSNTIVFALNVDALDDGFNRILRGSGGLSFLTSSSGRIRFLVQQAAGTSFVETTTDVRGAGWVICAARWNRTTQALDIRLNGVTEGTSTGADQDKTNSTTAFFGSVGGSSFFRGSVGEGALSEKYASDSELEAIEAKLAATYGVTLP